MESLIKKLKEKLEDHLITLLVIGIIGSIVLIANLFLSIDFIEKVGSLTWFRLAIFLFILCLILGAYIYGQIKLKYIPELGIYQHKRTGIYFCTSCKVNGKKSPLKEYESGWRCLNKDCKNIYYKPGKEPGPQKIKVISKGINNGWMNLG